jgi:hypothetical protein
VRPQFPANVACSADRRDPPRQGEDIAPVAVSVKKGLERRWVRHQRLFELAQPILCERYGRDCFRVSCQHLRLSRHRILRPEFSMRHAALIRYWA